ncbi:MAG: hypothetical protein H0T75_16870 [Rhizobiales bacterium]|nr:hypothetical protein [Hyphomicrobiales bacterium]
MHNTTRTILVALGVALLVVVLVPLVLMMGMMSVMPGGMSGMMNGGGWMLGSFVLVILVVGIALLAIGVVRRR